MFGKRLKNDVILQEVVCETRTIELGYRNSRYTCINLSTKVHVGGGINNISVIWASGDEAVAYLADKKPMIRCGKHTTNTFILLDKLLIDVGFFRDSFNRAALSMREPSLIDVIAGYKYDIRNMLRSSLIGYPLTLGYDKNKGLWSRLGNIESQGDVGELRSYRVGKDIHTQILLDKLNNKQTT